MLADQAVNFIELFNTTEVSAWLYDALFIVTLLLWAVKKLLNLYKEKKEIDDKFKDL